MKQNPIPKDCLYTTDILSHGFCPLQFMFKVFLVYTKGQWISSFFCLITCLNEMYLLWLFCCSILTYFIIWYQGQKVMLFMFTWKCMTLGPAKHEKVAIFRRKMSEFRMFFVILRAWNAKKSQSGSFVGQLFIWC